MGIGILRGYLDGMGWDRDVFLVCVKKLKKKFAYLINSAIFEASTKNKPNIPWKQNHINS
jgi:hypothetical protein